MRLKMMGVLCALLIISLVTLPPIPLTFAQNAAPFTAELTVRADQPKGIINRNIYGQFAEHLGRLIYGGLWVGEDSPIPNTRGPVPSRQWYSSAKQPPGQRITGMCSSLSAAMTSLRRPRVFGIGESSPTQRPP